MIMRTSRIIMPTPTQPTREARRRAVAEILTGLQVRSQAELAAHLEQRGIEVNQATMNGSFEMYCRRASQS